MVKQLGFPEKNYTPFGYIQNPYHQCDETYYDARGGILRTDNEFAGLGWYYPWIKRPTWYTTTGFGVIVDGEPIITRKELTNQGLYSKYHSTHILSYNIHLQDQIEIEERYWLSSENQLAYRLRFDSQDQADQEIKFLVINHVKRTEGYAEVSLNGDKLIFSCQEGEKNHLPKTYWSLNIDESPEQIFIAETIGELKEKIKVGATHKQDEIQTKVFENGEIWVATAYNLKVAGEGLELTGLLSREDEEPIFNSDRLAKIEDSYQKHLAADREYYQDFPMLTGDWPEYWQNGWIYDFETTRLCTLPAYGIFEDYWPTWMITWPRAVLAEGTMDMNRFGYADLDVAKRAIKTLFHDTPMDNVPCVFSSGGYNMVAKDGSRCGTSPAWCVPFYNIYELYLRDLDKEWIGELYPHMKNYLNWWLENRTDEEEWVVYKCTWESGEDNNPRLDPEGTGDNVISENVRPVELQVVMAHSAYIMKVFAQKLGFEEDLPYWTQLEDKYKEKLQQLWDEDSNRFRDLDKKTGEFIRIVGVEDYWEADFTRHSPLSLTTLLLNMITPVQKEQMKEEVKFFNRVPFIIWPSWNFTAMEAAINLDMYQFAAETSFPIIDRVYRENDRRDIDETDLPLPGAAREYWPLDIKDFTGNDAYAWGAQTSLLIIKQILGLRSSENTEENEMIVSPSLPQQLLEFGDQFGINQFYYRGHTMSINYRIEDENSLKTEIIFEKPVCCQILDSNSEIIYTGEEKKEHQFVLENFRKYIIKLS